MPILSWNNSDVCGEEGEWEKGVDRDDGDRYEDDGDGDSDGSVDVIESGGGEEDKWNEEIGEEVNEEIEEEEELFLFFEEDREEKENKEENKEEEEFEDVEEFEKYNLFEIFNLFPLLLFVNVFCWIIFVVWTLLTNSKSIILHILVSSSYKKLSNFKSQWIHPFLCKYWTPKHICFIKNFDIVSSNVLLFMMCEISDSPFTLSKWSILYLEIKMYPITQQN